MREHTMGRTDILGVAYPAPKRFERTTRELLQIWFRLWIRAISESPYSNVVMLICSCGNVRIVTSFIFVKREHTNK